MTVAVLGAGGGGLSATIELTRDKNDVILWNRNPARLAPYRETGEIPFRGIWGSGTSRPFAFSTDLADTLSRADVVVVCLPGVVHPQLFAELARLKPSAPIILNPGHTGGALHLRTVFTSLGVTPPPVAEFSTLTYVARVDADGTDHIMGRAGAVRAACLPGGHEALDAAVRLFHGATPVSDVLASSLSNVNLVLHPPGAILGAAWVEATGGDFTFYVDGMTPGVGRVLDQLDAERLAVASAFGHALPSLLDEMVEVGTVDVEAAKRGDTVAAIRGGVANSTIAAPDSFRHRYYQEDLAFGLQPFSALATVAGVDVPVANSLMKLGGIAVGGDLLSHGLTGARLGLDGLTRDELVASVTS
ncbi:MAG: NAD/NADP octopine/nopaline dehydrogenase [Microbacteriaceae bacterium]|nr:MAG: NAD/NADP octopine/nopaline dehydrogenase [Microbacteriaceae bacterium]